MREGEERDNSDWVGCSLCSKYTKNSEVDANDVVLERSNYVI